MSSQVTSYLALVPEVTHVSNVFLESWWENPTRETLTERTTNGFNKYITKCINGLNNTEVRFYSNNNSSM